MDKIFKFKISENLYKGERHTVYRGTNPKDETSVILKMVDPSAPNPIDIIHLKHEYEILQKFNTPDIVKPIQLKAFDNTMVMVLEDIRGTAIDCVPKIKDYTTRQLVELSLQITRAIEKIHDKNIIHQNISPSNLVLNPETGQINLIDFKNAAVLSRGRYNDRESKILIKDLPYVSPEQTGRINRVIDFKSDFYSLGITLYHLFTGTLPFEATDSMEIIHSHLAKAAAPPDMVCDTAPEPVSDIIMKLMAKTPEDRYKSAAGIRHDLEICLKYIKENRSIKLNIGEKDFSKNIEIPDRLYGRKKPLQTIWSAIEKIGQGENQILTIAGAAGMGKTALMDSIDAGDIENPVYLVSGKFDQLEKDIPYSAVKNALQILVELHLGADDSAFEHSREKMVQAVGPNGQLIADIVPEITKIIGPQKPVRALPPIEEKNRFIYVFKNFIRTLMDQDRPIVLFIDDLQWADSASLELLRIICTTEDVKDLLFIGAYRDTEVDETHPWVCLIHDFEQKNMDISHINLFPLDSAQISELISDALNLVPQICAPLSEMILIKSGGNPFLVHECLTFIHSKKFLWFDALKECWLWNMENIRTMPVSEGGAGFILEKIQNQTPKAQDLLKIAACIGNRFDFKTLSIASQTPVGEVLAALRQSAQNGIILHSGDLFELAEYDFSDRADQQNAQGRFSHDRIQHAIYSLIPEKERPSFHFSIGKQLLDAYSDQTLEKNLFSVVNQLNSGKSLISDTTIKLTLVKLNLNAGKKAAAASAHEAAYQYFKTGIELLESTEKNQTTVWDELPDLCLGLHEGAAESAFLSGQYEQMDTVIGQLDRHIKKNKDKAKIYELKTASLYARNKMDDAIEVALTFAKKQGVHLPKFPGKFHLVMEVIKTRFALTGKRVEDLASLPPMTDPDILAALRVLSSVTLAAFYSRPNLLPIIAFKSIQLSMKHGNTDSSVFGYAGYGMMQCGILGNIDTGNQFGRLATDLVKKLELDSINSRIVSTVAGFITHWKNHLKQTIGPLRKAHTSGLETGDHQFASICAKRYCSAIFLTGRPLGEVDQKTDLYLNIVKQLKQDVIHNSISILKQVIQNLRGKSISPWHLKGEAYDMDAMYEKLTGSNDELALFTQFSMASMLCYLFDKPAQALELSDQAWTYHETARGMPEYAVFIFYDSLIRIAGSDRLDRSDRKKLLKKIVRNQKFIKKWADACPENFAHKYDLVQSEQYRLGGFLNKAKESYACAIKGARENGFLSEEALSYELAAKCDLAAGSLDSAKSYMANAYQCYDQWGATAKVKRLEKQYGDAFLTRHGGEPAPDSRALYTAGNIEDTLIQKHDMDILTVIKASQALAKQTETKALMSKLIRLILENSGAQKAFLFLYSHGQLRVEAFAQTNPDEIKILQAIPLDDGKLDVAESIIHYVLRSNESIIIDHASTWHQSATDRHLAGNKPLSVLCAPILSKNVKLGVLYLENNLIQGAFSKERLKILDILISQAVVSIENSRLYEKLHVETEKKSKAFGEIILHKKMLQNISAELAGVEDRERKAIADDLHDSVTQSLAVSILQIKKIKKGQESQIRGDLDKVQAHLEQAADEIRSLTSQLSPKILYDLGLVPALEWLAEDLHTRFGLSVTISNQIDPFPDLDETVKILIFRSIRELCINIVKHAKTNMATLELSIENSHLSLRVEDRGSGFSQIANTQNNKKGGFGLCSIGERMQALNGEISIHSELEKGTQIVLSIPLTNNRGI